MLRSGRSLISGLHAPKRLYCSCNKCADTDPFHPNPYDNACIESFHALIKREWLNRFSIRNYHHAYRLVFEYIEAVYNTVRIHSHCDYMSPAEFEKLYEKVTKLPAA